ncbi:MAG: DUF29 family protein [Azospirillum sp.]|nr:DUF29 family protein [Azospirillum sp.]
MTGPTAYFDDFFRWTQEQGRLLEAAARSGAVVGLDFENLAEEVCGLGRAQKRAVQWALTRAIEYLIKLEYSPDHLPRENWEEAVIANRFIAGDALAASPGLKAEIDFERAYRDGRRMAMVGLDLEGSGSRALPAACPYTLDQILDEAWWPVNRRGLP